MDFGQRLWAVYLEEHGFTPTNTKIKHLDGMEIAQALWWFSTMLSPRRSAIAEVGYLAEHEEGADVTLANLAITKDRHAMEAASLGAWGVLASRWGWSVTAIMLETERGIRHRVPVPQGAPMEVVETAALLRVLGTLGREPPPEWRDLSPDGELSRFLGSSPAWRQ